MTFQVTFKGVNKFGIDNKVIGNCIDSVFGDSVYKAENIQIVICSDRYLKKININFLQHNYYTDVITFTNRKKSYISGEIFISLDTIIKNSKIFSSGNFEKELFRVIIHGLLHLIGHDDFNETERNEMTRLENYYLGKIRLL